MKFSDAVKYYSRRDVRQEMVRVGEGREVVPKFGNKGFGKRPAILMYEREIYEMARNGAISFHCSEEHWSNPLLLGFGSDKKQMDELRTGWDLIIDVDTSNFEYSKTCTELIIEALRFHGLKNVSLKFSGNKGWHVGVAWQSFPEKINGIKTSLLFPEAPRIITLYLKEFMRKHLKERLGLKEGDVYSLVELDTVFVAPRHLFRMPYSLHEKSGLVSVPVELDELMDFKKEFARPERVDIKPFLDKYEKNEANELFQRAYNWYANQQVTERKHSNQVRIPEKAVPQQFFPPCIQNILNGVIDGRKRSVFVLLNFLRRMGWDYEQIEQVLWEWNERNKEPLREGYIRSQINWHKRQTQTRPPPNCNNKTYYLSMAVCKPDNLCKKISNPVTYSYRKIRK